MSIFSFQEQPRDQFSEQFYSISQIVPDREYATVSPYIKKDFQRFAAHWNVKAVSVELPCRTKYNTVTVLYCNRYVVCSTFFLLLNHVV